MNKKIKGILKRFKLSLNLWYFLPNFIQNNIPQRFIKRTNDELFVLLSKIIKKRQSGLLVIGANDGFSFDDLIPSILKYLSDEQIENNAFFVEPIPYYYEMLTKNLSPYNSNGCYSLCYNVALHPTKNSEVIYMVDPALIDNKSLPDWLAGSSSFSYNLLAITHNLQSNQILSKQVECVTFDKLMAYIEDYRKVNQFKYNKLDYLQIDTEGFDDMILDMIDYDKYDICIIKFEKVHFSDLKIEEIRMKMSNYYYCLDFGEDEVCIRKNNS